MTWRVHVKDYSMFKYDTESVAHLKRIHVFVKTKYRKSIYKTKTKIQFSHILIRQLFKNTSSQYRMHDRITECKNMYTLQTNEEEIH